MNNGKSKSRGGSEDQPVENCPDEDTIEEWNGLEFQEIQTGREDNNEIYEVPYGSFLTTGSPILLFSDLWMYLNG